jgi:undecaprenyl-diphosphatase
MDLPPILSALLLGIVEGLTEFLPVSSTGHLILVIDLLGFAAPPGRTFEIVIQLGAVLAVMLIYAKKLFGIAFGLLAAGREGREARAYTANILLAFIPAMVLGATLHGVITERLFNPWVVSVALIVGGVAIILIEKFRPVPRINSVAEIGWGAALLIGFAQSLAMIPGTSRSGATIIGALLVGVARPAAAEFSFVLAIPTMLAATTYSLYKTWGELTFDGATLIAAGFVSAFIVALIVVRAVLAVIGRIGFTPFGYYRIVVGTVMLAILWAR